MLTFSSHTPSQMAASQITTPLAVAIYSGLTKPERQTQSLQGPPEERKTSPSFIKIYLQNRVDKSNLYLTDEVYQKGLFMF